SHASQSEQQRSHERSPPHYENLAAGGWPHQVASRVKTMPLYWLCYRHNNQISVVIEPGASLIHAKMRSVIDGLDQGEFTEGHELDRRSRVSEGDDRTYQKA